MENRANYALIGAAIVFTAVALMGVILWMGQVQFNRDYQDYDVVFDGPVNGLSEGAAVRYLGLKVGEVEDLTIDPQNDTRVVARIRIDSKTPVRMDSTAILDFVGLTGATFIQIQPGTPTQPLKRTAGGVPVITTEPTQLDNLVSGGQQIMSDASGAMERLNLLLSDDNVASLSTTLRNIETISTELAAEEGLVSDIRGTLTRVDRAVVSLEKAANSIDRLANTADGQMVRVGDGLDLAMVDLRRSTSELTDALSGASDQFTRTLMAVENPAVEMLVDARVIGQDLQLLIARLDRLAREFEADPRALVLGERLPESR